MLNFSDALQKIIDDANPEHVKTYGTAAKKSDTAKFDRARFAS